MSYNEFINNILETRGRFACGDQYHERHHIKPKCTGGSNAKDNLIDLFPQEHFIAHKLLSDENPQNEQLAWAYSIMAFMKPDHEDRYELTPEEYAEARQRLSGTMRRKYADKTAHPCYNTHLSEERKRQIGEVNKGNKYCVGRVVSRETRDKISEANRNPSPETRKRMSDARKGKHVGSENSNAKLVIRLSDNKVYHCLKEAAEDNNINYSTFKTQVHRNRGFMKYDEYCKLHNYQQ